MLKVILPLARYQIGGSPGGLACGSVALTTTSLGPNVSSEPVGGAWTRRNLEREEGASDWDLGPGSAGTSSGVRRDSSFTAMSSNVRERTWPESVRWRPVVVMKAATPSVATRTRDGVDLQLQRPIQGLQTERLGRRVDTNS